jgi:hypothetical protein
MACLVIGYAINRQWIGVVGAGILGFTWWYSWNNPTSWETHICLLVTASLAVVGILLGTPPFLMILGSGMGLALWDLIYLNDSLKTDPPDVQTRHYEIKHLQLLLQLVVSGVFLGFAGHFLRFDTPFILLVVIIILALFSLNRIWQYFRR